MPKNVKFYLVRADQCPACKGLKTRQHPLMPAFKEWTGAPEDFYYRHKIMPETLQQPRPCHVCSGTGEIRNETTLAAALAEMGLLEQERADESNPEPT